MVEAAHPVPDAAGVYLGHIAGFAFQITEDQRAETGLAHFYCYRFQGLLRAGDQLEVAAGKHRIAGLDGFRGRVLQPTAHRSGGVDVVTLEDRQGLL
ncbi:hypothetical protein PFLmoz3_03267 [Pseudomonas fluorescens]|uniref:Uncharacterized protein n=1 Tax=Pseudomonas fluorescens TaxID=294 RepID=A0A120G7L8_PSEFL|nr:hypothetical protein PFLmoz3_03267 [Pseudomonas fluorescens]